MTHLSPPARSDQRSIAAFFATALLLWLLLPATVMAQYGPPVGDTDYDDSNANLFLTDEVMFIDITMDPADLQSLFDNRQSDEYRYCEARFRNSQIDEVVTDIGIRVRGNVARNNKKFPLKLSFNKFVPGRKFHGLEKFNLNPDSGDSTFSKSETQFKIFRDLGVPAPRTNHAYVTINDGTKIEGVYIQTEQVDDEFVQAWFGNKTGDLYKCRNANAFANLNYVAPGTPETYQALGNGETYQEQITGNPYITLADFIDFLDKSDDATFEAEIDNWINVDGFLRAMAVDQVCGQWDGYWFGANNYYLYHNQETQKFEYIPWDLDNSFGADYFFIPLLFGEDWARRGYANWGQGGFGGYAILHQRLVNIPYHNEALKRFNHEIIEKHLSLAGHEPATR
jgi:spore coat protein H